MSALDIENWIKTTYSTISNNRTYYIWLSKKDNLMLLNQCETLSINLNTQHVNEITHFDGKLAKMYVRLLDTLE